METAMDARELASALAQDVDLHFERMVREYQDRLYGFALRLTSRPEDAEEAVQDAFVRAYRALKTYPSGRIRSMALRAWLYQITLNVVRNRFRRKRHPTEALDGAAAQSVADPAEGPEARLETARQRQDLASLVGKLPARYRTPLVLRYVEGLKLEEVSEILGQPLGTTKSNVHRAINALREAITQSRRQMRWSHA
ncbi:MAG TPA: sigma-70 family RNA polymerase sigma factor [Thermoanaerobaculia bacterium]|nr:sigma-70 family RNA polymerase sigma factor [Thermoanaerobaculia bacterium]